VSSFAADVRSAYDATGAAWANGPQRLYAELATELVACCPVPLEGAQVLDAGAGTGVVAAAAAARGAQVVAVDLSSSMLQHSRATAVVGDVGQLPFADAVFDAVLSGCCINHVPDPVAVLAAMRRVVRAGGAVVASTFATAEPSPVKAAVEEALAHHGWRPPAWFATFKRDMEPAVGDPATLQRYADAAGLTDVRVVVCQPATGLVDVDDQLSWRLGMAQTAPFVAGLSPERRAALHDDIRAALATLDQPARPAILVLSARVRA
jgi:2-polyprenyl-6-hydroxyphenyl methylase/3-demethylubiquinone-9 3-methyltransferase